MAVEKFAGVKRIHTAFKTLGIAVHVFFGEVKKWVSISEGLWMYFPSASIHGHGSKSLVLYIYIHTQTWVPFKYNK